MKNRTVTVVSNKKGMYSIHFSFSSACEAYNWDYNKYKKKRMPPEIDGFFLRKHPVGITIDCLELLEFTHRKKVLQTSIKLDNSYEVMFDGYNKGYTLMVEYTTLTDEPEYHNGDRGKEEVAPGGKYDNPIGILEVFKHDEDSTIIKIDEYTQRELLNLINLVQ